VLRRPPPASDREAFLRLSRQRQEDTRPERLVRRLLAGLGHRFRLHNRDLPGSPDCANRTRRWVVFVHGCYWHHHPGCPRATVPKRNRAWWKEKFRDNRRRDARVAAALATDGYRVVTIWECECEDVVTLQKRLRHELPRPPARGRRSVDEKRARRPRRHA